MTAFPDAVGFAVAGGASHRMGRDKALLPWGDTTLLDHTMARLTEVCGSVRILSGPEARYADRGVPVDTDAMTGAGSLGGVYTGLLRLGDGPGLFLGVDLPFVPVPLLRRLLELSTEHYAVVPVSRGGPEPLCAVYTRACLEPIRRALDEGRLKMTSFWAEIRLREVPLPELAVFGDVDTLFRNVNTPEDYERARSGLRER